jgi:hypothetical protein
MEGKPSLTLVTQPQDFFRELVTEALGRNRVVTKPETEVYLVNLLNQFMTADQLHSWGTEGGSPSSKGSNGSLALMIKEALEISEPAAQSRMFRHIGDVSLYTAGFFQDSLNRKLVDVDYYIEMGGAAYKQVAARTPEEVMRTLFQELAQKFSSLVDVLATVGDKTAQKTEKDILRIYELWVRTRSDRHAKALQEAGIVPNQTIKKDWQ